MMQLLQDEAEGFEEVYWGMGSILKHLWICAIAKSKQVDEKIDSLLSNIDADLWTPPVKIFCCFS
jgi:hypothetical protein